MNLPTEKKRLRQTFRQKRKKLSKSEQLIAAIKLKNFLNQTLLKKIKHQKIALYVSTQSELGLEKIARLLKAKHHRTFLPIVKKIDSPLTFREAPVSNWRLLPKKHFNIPEPECRRDYKAKQLDIIFTPLLAFDNNLNRLGMGGGFYDRTLAQIAKKRRTTPPLIIGIGYDFQRYKNKLPTEPNDIRPNAIITPSKLFTAR